MRRDRKTVLITDAAEDPERELRRRERRYVATMLLRAVCLVVGAIVVSARPPLWPFWAGLCVVGMVLLPWLAVIRANDRPAKSKAERLAKRQERGQAAIQAPRDERVIDGE